MQLLLPFKRLRAALSNNLIPVVWCGLVILAIVPFASSSRYVIYLGTLLALQGVLAVSLNLIIGYAGQFALAHTAFYGIGAYVSAIAIRDLGASFWASMPISALAVGGLAAAIGYPSLRYTGGIHFALITFAFAELMRLVAANWDGVTRGAQGLQVNYSPEPVLGIDMSSNISMYALAIGLLALSIVVIWFIRRSRFGRALVAIREDEVLAQSLGVNITGYKVGAFAVASAIAALAGTIYAPFIGFISPEMMNASESVSLVGMLIVGGIGTMSGPLLGVLLFMVVPEILRIAKLYRLVVLGLVIVWAVLFMRDGIAGLLSRRRPTAGQRGQPC